MKVDAKTKAQLDEWKKKKWREKNKLDSGKKEVKEEEREEGEAKESDSEDEEAINALDEFSMREDRVAKAGLDAIMREYSGDLARAPWNSGVEEQERERSEAKRFKQPRLEGPRDSVSAKAWFIKKYLVWAVSQKL